MALETLLDSQRLAAQELGVDFNDLIEMQTPRIVMDDIIQVGNLEVPILRSHSGRAGSRLIGKGGIRMANFENLNDAINTVKELSAEMLAKLAIRGFTDSYMGAKGIMVFDPSINLHKLDGSVKAELMRKYAVAMNSANLAGGLKDVPAGDMFTNGLSDYYAQAYHEAKPKDKFWRASITGKSPKMGGLDFRPAATGWGTYNSQLSLMNIMGHKRGAKAIMGLGNVAGWDAYFSSNNPDGTTPVEAISDFNGTLWTDSPEGLIFTLKMVEEVTDNPDFKGNKLHEIARRIEENQPGIHLGIKSSEDILSFPTEYFTPAALGNVITAKTVQSLGAKLGIIEAANGPTTPEAHQYLVKNGINVVPDIIANGAGVDCSITERNANMNSSTPSKSAVKEGLSATSQHIVEEMINISELAPRFKDPRIAAAALGIARMLSDEQPTLSRELNLVAN